MTVARDWKTSQRYIRIGHNKAIRNYFKTVNTTTRENLRNNLLMYKDDSAPQMLVKMQYFNQYLSEDTLPIVPDSWSVKVPKGRPQLMVVFKPKDDNYSKPDSRWTLSLPHFKFTRTNLESQLKKIPDYEKGKYQGIFTLTDNSKIIVYARSDRKARQFIKTVVNRDLIINEYIPEEIPQRRVRDQDIRVSEVISRSYQEVEVTPTYVKYFSTGQKNLNPDWTAFIN